LVFGLVEAFAPKSEDPVGACTVILPCDGRSQLDELRGGKALFQTPAQIVADARRGGGNGVGKLQDQFLVAVEQIALLVPVQIADLIVSEADRSASGRVDVDSKRTFHQLGGADLGQPFKLGRDQTCFIQGQAELRVGNQNVRMGGQRIQWGYVFL